MVIDKLNEEEKRNAIVEHLDKNMFVEAGAGAGKTSLIVKRNIAQLKAGKLQAPELVDITFTKAAAEELRTRLLECLHEEAEKATGVEKNNLEKAIREESLIQISTIHSFCSRLLKEQSFAAKLPLDVEILENGDDLQKKKTFFEQWYKSLPVNEAKELEKEFYRGNAASYLYKTFLELCELPEETEIRYEKDLVAAGAPKFDDYIGDIRKQLQDILDEILRIAKELKPEANYKDYEDIASRKTANEWHASISASSYNEASDCLKSKNVKKLLDAYKGCWEKDKKTLKSGFDKRTLNDFQWDKKEEGVEANIRFEAACSRFPYLIDNLQTYQAAVIIQKAIEAAEKYREFCICSENRHGITNDALLQETLKLLKENKEARNYFQRKFSCIYVDEFQDTDPVQRDLILLLCKDPDNEDCYQAGKFFLVGDPKQSIYAFRGADVDVYEETKKMFSDPSEETEVYILQKNFRSEKGIIDWVNREFVPKFKDILQGGYQPMETDYDYPDEGKVLSGVYCLDYPSFKKEEKDKDKKVTEAGSDSYYKKIDAAKKIDAEMVVTIIRYLKENGYQIRQKVTTEDGKEDAKLRPVEYRDFLLLCDKKADLNIYADRLKKAGIPVSLFGALNVEEDEILLRFHQVYRYLTYPFDKKAEFGAMQVLLGKPVTDENKEEGGERCDKLRDMVVNMNGMVLLQYLAHRPELFLAEKVTGEEALTARSRLQQMLEYLLQKDLGDRKDVERKLSDFLESDVDRELILLKDQDAVRLMNLHKAKGLEGNIVVAAARTERFDRSGSSSYRHCKEYYPAVSSGSGFGNDGIAGFLLMKDKKGNAIKDAATNKAEAEGIREDYVEVTRAKEVLLFMDALDNDCVFNDYSFDGVKNLLEISEDLAKGVRVARDGASGEESEKEEKPYECFQPVEVPEKQKKETIVSVIPSALETVMTTGFSEGESGYAKETDRPHGNVFGTILHRVYELLFTRFGRISALDAAGRKAEVSKAVAQAVAEQVGEMHAGDDPVAITSYLEGKMEEYFDKVIVPVMKNAAEVYPEFSFSFYVPEEETAEFRKRFKKFETAETDRFWVNGQADLVVKQNDGRIKVYDYKSDARNGKPLQEFEKALEKKYQRQLELYRYAVGKAFNMSAEEVETELIHLYR